MPVENSWVTCQTLAAAASRMLFVAMFVPLPHGIHGPSKAAFFGCRWWVYRRVEPGLLLERESACLAIVKANVPVVVSSLVNATMTADGIGSEGWLRVKERP